MNLKIIAKNPTARHNYDIKDTMEAGIVLFGTEIKSIRQGKVNLKDSYAIIKNGECFVYGLHISPYEQGNIFNKDPLRTKKLLLSKKEILKFSNLIKQQGLSLIPLSLYFKGNFVKLELGIGKGKKLYDKREDIAKKDAEMKIRKAMKERVISALSLFCYIVYERVDRVVDPYHCYYFILSYFLFLL